MFLQWCVKGVCGIDDAEVRAMLAGDGILCNWWRRVNVISPRERRAKLTAVNLDLHVNDYDAPMPDGTRFHEGTPFLSLSAGCVSREVLLRTNVIHPARRTALRFAMRGGRRDGYLFFCWLIVGLKPAAEIEDVAEEVRELNTSRSYSDYQTEGEITAKIEVRSSQIQRVEHVDPRGRLLGPPIVNPAFVRPERLSNLCEPV